MISSPKCVNGCFRSHLVYDLLGHGENVVLLLPEHHEALQPVHQAGQPHGVAHIDRELPGQAQEGRGLHQLGLLVVEVLGLVLVLVVELITVLAVG